MPLIFIEYKYNSHKVLSFISIMYSGITKDCISYLSKYSEQFANFSILPVVCTLITSNLFGFVNEVDSHNKFRESNFFALNDRTYTY